MPFEVIEPKSFPYLDYKRYSFSLGVRVGNYIFTSGHTASKYEESLGKVVCEGNLEAQAHVIYDKIGIILEAAGTDFDHVFKIIDYVSPMVSDQTSIIDSVSREYLRDNLPFRSRIFVDGLTRRDALLEVECVASQRSIERSTHEDSSKVLRVDDLAFAASESRQWDSDSLLQAYHECLTKLGTVGLGKQENTVSVHERVAFEHISDQLTSNLKYARSEIFGLDLPPVTTLGVNKLSAPDSVFEIELTALKSRRGIERKETGSESAGNTSDSCECRLAKGERFSFISCSPKFPRSNGSEPNTQDIFSQTKSIYDSVLKTLSSNGLSEKDIFKTIDYYTRSDKEAYGQTGKIRREIFSGGPPASTGIMTKSLLHPSAKIDIECVLST